MFAAAMATILALDAQTSYFGDDDRDGLLNGWERTGRGPLSPKLHGCKPDHSDLVLCYCLRNGVTPEKIKPAVDRMVRFFAEMPCKNLDGTTGIHLIPIILPPLGEADKGQGYPELYEAAMPKEWRGLAHGILVEDNPGGGGQANRPDWAGTGYNFWTMTHELGHQLGLPHTPLNSNLGSPLHTSLMNYDYSYQLNGDPEKVHYSVGQFASLQMRESDLDEVLPFPADQLEFLTKQPHFFGVKAIDKGTASVDWNRNGIFGEHHVQANINDGYAAELTSSIKGGKLSGAPVLVSSGSGLYLVGPSSAKLDLCSPNKESPAVNMLYAIRDGKCVEMGALPGTPATGDLSAILERNTLSLAYATATGWTQLKFSLGNGKCALVSETQHEGPCDPTLVRTPLGLMVLLSNRITGEVTLKVGSKTLTTGLKTTHPVGAVWNPKTQRLAIAITQDKEAQKGRILIVPCSVGKNAIATESPIPIGDEQTPALTSGRPILMVDTTRAGGPKGAYKAIVKGLYPDPNQPGLNFLCRQIGTGNGWWIKMLGNEWANSRSVGSAVEFQGAIAYAYRWFGGPEDNSVWITPNASGIEDGIITDFDEVTFIAEHGLRDSLNAVRNEQWPVKNWH
ncbi:MAG: hypothetical protein JST40_04940 [Armatimonadetes bacterium]|nr:hypothetical protein [Armatimonadota bacterium]